MLRQPRRHGYWMGRATVEWPQRDMLTVDRAKKTREQEFAVDTSDVKRVLARQPAHSVGSLQRLLANKTRRRMNRRDSGALCWVAECNLLENSTVERPRATVRRCSCWRCSIRGRWGPNSLASGRVVQPEESLIVGIAEVTGLQVGENARWERRRRGWRAHTGPEGIGWGSADGKRVLCVELTVGKACVAEGKGSADAAVVAATVDRSSPTSATSCSAMEWVERWESRA